MTHLDTECGKDMVNLPMVHSSRHELIDDNSVGRNKCRKSNVDANDDNLVDYFPLF